MGIWDFTTTRGVSGEFDIAITQLKLVLSKKQVCDRWGPYENRIIIVGLLFYHINKLVQKSSWIIKVHQYENRQSLFFDSVISA